LTSDTGALSSDLITREGDLSPTGVDDGASVQYSTDGGLTWTSNFSAQEGTNSVLVRQVDAAGNATATTTPFVFRLDTTAPTLLRADTAGQLQDAEKNGKLVLTFNGRVDGDRTLSPGTFTVSVNGETKSVSFAGVSSDGKVDLVITNHTFDENDVVTVSYQGGGGVFDLAGNAAPAFSSTVVTNNAGDTTPPAVAEILSLVDDVAGFTGEVGLNGLTNDAHPGILVKAESGSTVVVYANGVQIDGKSDQVGIDDDGNGLFLFTPHQGLLEGDLTLQAAAIDVNDNISSLDHYFYVTVDLTAPTLPGVSLVEDTSKVGLENGNADLITSNGAIQVATEANATKAYSADNGLTWSSTFTAAEGGNTVLVRVTDAAGNTTVSAPFSFTLDTTKPAPAALQIVRDPGSTAAKGFSVETGVSLTFQSTLNGVTSTLTGSEVFTKTTVSGRDIYRAKEDAFDGSRIIKVTANTIFDAAGNESLQAVLNNQRIDTTGPTATVNLFAEQLDDDSSSTTVTITFSERPFGFNPALDLIIEGGSLGTGSFDATGKVWTATYTADVGFEGSGSVTLKNDSYTDEALNAGGGASDTVDVRVDLTPPTFKSPPLAAVNENQNRLYTASATDASGAVTYSLVDTFDGLLSIDELSGVVTLGTGNLDAEGQNQFEFTVRAQDATGNSSTRNVTVHVNDLDETNGGAIFDGSSAFGQSDPTAGFGSTLVNESLPLAVGTDVLVNGTAFLGGGLPGNMAAAAGLLGAADVTVKLGQDSLDDEGILSRTDAQFDQLIANLQAAGIDSVSIDSDQALQLAEAGFSFDAGVDVLVSGTAFLGVGSPVNMAAGAAGLFGDADVTATLTPGDVGSIVSYADGHDFDAIVNALQGAGVDTISIDAGQVGALANAPAGFDFDAGTDVLVNGTAFLGGGSPVNMAAAAGLFGDADVTVALSTSDGQYLLTQTDAQFDQLIDDLQAAGMDTLSIDAGQAAALALSDENFTFDAGTDVLVNGTAFLGGGSPVNMAAAAGLFGDADVTVALTTSDGQQLLTQTDAQFDQLIDDLQAAGMDTLSIDAGQAAALALSDANFSFDAGTDVLVNGTAFLGGGSPVNTAAAARLFGDADVTVALTTSDGQQLLSGTHEQFDQLIDDLQAAGMDTLSIDAGQALAFSSEGFTFDAGTNVIVHGTAFLSAPPENLAALFNKLDVDGETKVSVAMSDGEREQLLRSDNPTEAVSDLLSALQEAGVDHFLAGASDLLEAVAAGVGGLPLNLVSMIELTEPKVTLADFQSAGFQSDFESSLTDDLAAVINGMDVVLGVGSLQEAAPDENPALYIDDDLANALGDALGELGDDLVDPNVDLVLQAASDGDVPGVSVLKASAEDLALAGVDKVQLGAGDDWLLSLQDGNDQGLSSFLSELPMFESSGSQHVGMVVTQDDLTALVTALGDGATEQTVAQTLSDKGITDLVKVDGSAVQVLKTADLSTSDYQVSEADLVKLLGGSSDSVDPFDPFHKP
jgi:hypothetical protein